MTKRKNARWSPTRNRHADEDAIAESVRRDRLHKIILIAIVGLLTFMAVAAALSGTL